MCFAWSRNGGVSSTLQIDSQEPLVIRGAMVVFVRGFGPCYQSFRPGQLRGALSDATPSQSPPRLLTYAAWYH